MEFSYTLDYNKRTFALFSNSSLDQESAGRIVNQLDRLSLEHFSKTVKIKKKDDHQFILILKNKESGEWEEIEVPLSDCSHTFTLKKLSLFQPSSCRKSVFTLWKETVNDYPKSLALLNVVWVFFISPFIALHRVYKEHERSSIENLKQLDQSLTFSTPYQLIDLIEIWNEEVGKTVVDDEFLNGHLKEAVEISRGLMHPSTVQSACYRAAKLLQEKCLEKKRDTPLLTLPLCYRGSDGNYRPLLATFINKEGQLHLQFHRTDSSDFDCIDDEYILGDVSIDSLSNLLFHLSLPMRKPTVLNHFTLSNREKTRVQRIEFFKSGGESPLDILSKQKHSRDQIEPAAWVNAAIQMVNGAKVESPFPDQPIKSTPYHLLSFLQGEDKRSKFEYLLNQVYQGSEVVLQALPYLNSSEKAAYLTLVERQVKRLEAHAEKRGINIADFKGPLKGFQKKLMEIKEVVENSKNEYLHDHEKSIQKSLYSSDTFININVDVPTIFNQSTGKSGSIQKIPDNIKVIIGDIEKAILDNNIKELDEKLKVLDDRVNQFVDKKHFKLVQLVVQDLFSKLPVPKPFSSKEKNIWDIPSLGDTISSDISEKLSNLSKYHWEAHMRLGKTFLYPLEITNLLVPYAIISKLARGYVRSFPTIKPDVFFTWTQMHPHYRVSQDPKEDRKLLELRNFILEEGSEKIDFSGVDHKQTKYESKRCYSIHRSDTYSTSSKFTVDLHRISKMIDIQARTEYVLCPRFKGGRLGQAAGLSWQNQLREKAKKRGATQANIKKVMKEIRWEMVQKELNKYKRLDFKLMKFVSARETEGTNEVAIVDQNLRGRGVTYLPRGYDFPDYIAFLKDYDLPANTDQTKALVGEHKGEGCFTSTSNQEDLSENGSYSRVHGTTSPLSEAAILERKLTGKVSDLDQMAEYLISDSEFVFDGEGTGPTTMDYSPIYEGSVLTALNYIRSRTGTLTNDAVQKKLELVLFRPWSLQRLLRQNPLYFHQFSIDLKRLIEENQKNEKIFCFLLHIADRLTHHMADAVESLHKEGKNDVYMKSFQYKFSDRVSDTEKSEIRDSQYPEVALIITNLEEAISTLPGLQAKVGRKEQTLLEILIKKMSTPGADKALVALRVIEFFKNQTIDIENLEEKELQALLHSIIFFMNGGRERGIPMVAEKSTKWISEKFIPELRDFLDNNPEKRQSIFNGWISQLTNQKAAVKSEWKITHNGYKNREFSIDLERFEIQSPGNELPFSLTETLIPDTVLNHPNFKNVFGTTPKVANVKMGAHLEEFIYSFKDKKQQFEVIFDKSKNTVVLNGEFTIHGKKKSYQYHAITSDIDNAFIKEMGIWFDQSNPKFGLIRVNSKEVYQVSLSRKGTVTDIKTLEGKYASASTVKQLKDTISFLHPDHVLFFRNKRSSGINEIHLNGIDGKLIKNGDQWIFTHPQFGKGEWINDLNEDALSLHSHASAYTFLKLFGKEHKQMMLITKKKEDLEILINPHAFQFDPASRKLNFQKEDSIVAARNTPILSIKFDEEGNINGSPAAFLYIAHLLGEMKEYEHAQSFLERALRSPLYGEREQEWKAFEHVKELITSREPKSLRQSAHQLRVELAMLQLLKAPYGKQWFNPENTLPYMYDIHRIVKMYNRYLSIEEDTSMIDRIAFSQQSVILIDEEKKELAQLRTESMRLFIQKYEDQIDKGLHTLQKVESMNFITPTSLLECARNVPGNLAAIIAVCSSDLMTSEDRFKEEFLAMESLSSEKIVRHFFHYWNLIAKGKITFEECSRLHLPIAEESQTAHEVVDYARKILLGLAYIVKYNGGGEIPTYNLLNVKYQKFKLPYFGGLPGRVGFVIDSLYMQLTRVDRMFEEALRNLQAPMAQLIGLKPNIPPSFKESDKDDHYQFVKDGAVPSQIREVLTNPLTKGLFSTLICELGVEVIDNADGDINEPKELKGLVNYRPHGGTTVLELHREHCLSERVRRIEPIIPEEEAVEDPEPTQENQGLFGWAWTLAKNIIPAKTDNLEKKVDDKITQSQEKLKPSSWEVNASEASWIDQFSTDFQQFFEETDGNHPLNIAETIKHFDKVDEGSNYAGMEKKENSELEKAFIKKGEELNSESGSSKLLIRDKLKNFSEFLQKEKIHTVVDHLRISLLSIYTSKRFREKGLVTDHERLSRLEMLYQAGELSDDEEKIMTLYLLHKSAFQQIQWATNELKKLDSETSEIKWKDVTNSIYQRVSSCLNWKRYLDEDGRVKEFKRSSYNLVTETKHKIIFRPGQLRIFDALNDSHQDWYNLRMGIGKTSEIMPRIPDFIGPCLLIVPEQLGEMNLKSFSKTTLELLNKRAIKFRSNINDPVSASYLAEKYHQLLEAIDKEQYAVTTMDQIADIIQLGLFLHEKLAKAVEEGNEVKVLITMKELMWVKKIIALIQKLPHFGDEVDEIFNILNEINRATGTPKAPNVNIRSTTRFLMELILNSKNGKPIFRLKQAILNGTAATLSGEEIQNQMKILALVLFESKEFKEMIGPGTGLESIDRNEFADYLIGVRELYPRGFHPDAYPSEVMGPLKMLLTHTFKSVLSMSLGNDIGLSDYTGGVLVPKKSKAEEEGMRYSEKYEVVLAQYYGYALMKECWSLTDTTDKYLTHALNEFQEKNPDRYDELVCAAKEAKLTVKEFIKTKKAWPFRFDLLDDITLEGGRLKSADEKIVLNVQDLVFNTKIGGVTGTATPFALPMINQEILFGEKMDSTRESEAETILRTAKTLDDGLDTPVHIYADSKGDEFIANTILNDPEAVGIINEKGTGMAGLSTLSWIKKLRKFEKLNGGRKHHFLFVHPEKRIPYLWKRDEKHPKPHPSKNLPKNTLTVWGPADTRGTDLPIDPELINGKIFYFPSETTNLQAMGQSLYRNRALGEKYKVQFCLSESIRQKVVGDKDSSTPSIGQTCQMIKKNSIEQQAPINLKAQLHKIEGERKNAQFKTLFTPIDAQMNDKYWSKENVDQIKKDAYFMAETFKKVRSTFFVKDEPDFRQDMEPTKKIDTVDEISKKYKETISALQSEHRLLRTASLAVSHPLIEAGIKNLGKALSQLKKNQSHFERNRVKYQEYLPKKCDKTSGNKTREKVKQKQKQKQKQNEKVQFDPTRLAGGTDTLDYIDFQLINLCNGRGKRISPTEGITLHCSAQMEQLYNRLKQLTGTPFGYLVVSTNWAGNKVHSLCSEQDFQLKISGNHKFKAHTIPITVYQLTPRGISLIDNNRRDTIEPDIQEVVKYKFFLGFSHFTPEELEVLKALYNRHSNLMDWAKEHGSRQQKELLEKINNQEI